MRGGQEYGEVSLEFPRFFLLSSNSLELLQAERRRQDWLAHSLRVLVIKRLFLLSQNTSQKRRLAEVGLS